MTSATEGVPQDDARGRLAFAVFRVVNDNEKLVGDPVDTVEEATEQAEVHSMRITHNRFANVFVDGISRRKDLRSGGIRPWPIGQGYEIHQVLVTEGEGG